ncbi:MAG: hypothetical protein ACJA01_000564 [Saprospiraceae bacterium]|jgi:hypothetical protein
MKMKIVFSLILLLFGIILMSYQNGPTNRTGNGYTGAPGEDGQVCADCHFLGFYSEPKTIISLADAITGKIEQSYRSGREYIVSLQVNSNKIGNGPNPRYGMQMTALDEDHMDSGLWAEPSNNAQISFTTVSGSPQVRAYLEHKSPSPSRIFSGRWKAPLCSTDTITFYHIGNAVNFDMGQSGDRGGNGDSTKFYPELAAYLYLDQLDTLDGTYYAKDSIWTSSNIRDTADVLLYSDEIILRDSFEVESLSMFQILIDTCQ